MYDIALSYQRFAGKDDDNFVRNLENEFLYRPEIPKMEPQLFKRFRKSIGEIFGNAVIHSQTQLGVFSCGQYFPKQNLLYFTVMDLGMGIRKNIIEHTNQVYTPEEAITWATTKNTISVNERDATTEQVNVKNVIIATGSEPAVPPVFEIDETDVLTTTGILELTELPESLLIVGGGVSGCEFASISMLLVVK